MIDDGNFFSFFCAVFKKNVGCLLGRINWRIYEEGKERKGKEGRGFGDGKTNENHVCIKFMIFSILSSTSAGINNVCLSEEVRLHSLLSFSFFIHTSPSKQASKSI